MAQARMFAATLLLAACLALAACVASAPTSAQARNPRASTPPPAPAGPATPPEIANENTNPTAIRLQDLGGQILLYYSEHHRLPATLGELVTDDPQVIVDPATGRPFIYNPQGPALNGVTGRVIAQQPVADPQGRYWVLLIDEHSHAGQVFTDIRHVPMQLLRPAPPAGQP